MKTPPPGFHSINPQIAYQDAAAAIEFYTKAFGAVERYRLPGFGGKGVGHAEITLGDSVLMLSDEFPDYGALSAKSLGGSPVRFAVYVPDVDVAFSRAVQAGCKPLREVADMFYGERSGTVEDPFGITWNLMTHIEDVSPDEMARRWEKECDQAES